MPANVAAAESAATTHVFTFEKEEITCTETKYAYGPINRGASLTLTVKPIIMQTGNLCKPGILAIATSETLPSKWSSEPPAHSSSGSEIAYLRAPSFYTAVRWKIAGTGCEIVFQGSSAGNEMCKRKVAATQAGLNAKLEKAAALKIEPNTAFTWSTENGAMCGEAEANGNHASQGNYKGTSVIGGGITIG